jgi:hypothetical protein
VTEDAERSVSPWVTVASMQQGPPADESQEETWDAWVRSLPPMKEKA